ncbi:TetR/AcrR family transcriptional regulator [Marinobacter hydrocarbonoclasticus]|nr:TetR/AcrR family transcriptional regulator [Marinobacter nauticus]
MASQRETQLLAVARELILEEGMVSFKFVEIAKRAEISRATLYKHFSGKEDVLVSLFVQDANTTREMLINIQNDASLNDQEKLITALLAPVSISMEQKNRLGTAFLSANPGIYLFATQERQDELMAITNQLRQVNTQLWMGPVQRGALKATPEQLQSVMSSLYPYQRGCVIIPQSVMTLGNQISRSLNEVYDNLLAYTQPLDWQPGHQEVRYEKVLKAIGKYEQQSMIAC